MRDDFQIPNVGQAPNEYSVSFFNRMARNIEMTLETVRSKGTATFTTINAETINISNAGTSFVTSVFVNGAAGTARFFGFLTNNVTRWLITADTTAESGSNAGSDLAIYRYNDAGTFLGQPVYIQRSTGKVFLEKPLQLPTSTVAALPAGTAGAIGFATNGRKNGEGVGAGTGVLVFHDGTAWRACDTGQTVSA